MKKFLKWLLIILIVVAVGTYGAFVVYTSDYYEMSSEATTYLLNDNNVSVSYEGDTIVFKGDTVKAAMIFYPGGKVDYRAYAPLLNKLAANGIECFMPKMPGNLAVLDQSAADKIRDNHPEIKEWYMGGHSLGGAVAAIYTEKNVEKYDGLVLLAAYSIKDLTKSNLNTILVIGDNDQVCLADKYEPNKSNLPANYSELVISGGNHAQFGMYGAQDGDGKPGISNEEQIDITVNYIIDRIFN